MNYNVGKMGQTFDSNGHHGTFPSLTLLRLLTLCGGLGVISAGAAGAEVATEETISERPAGVYSSADLLQPHDRASASIQPAARPQPEISASPSPILSNPRTSPSVPLSPSSSAPASGSAAMQELPPAPPPTSIVTQVAAPASGPAVAPAPAPIPSPMGGTVPETYGADNYGSVFIDPTDYSLGATPAPQAPQQATQTPALTFSERSTGCQITLATGAPIPGATCGTSASVPSSQAAGGIQVGPVTIGPRGVSLGSTTILSREFLNQRLRPLNVLRRGNEEYVFPLSVPAPITSLFGWRVHPVYNSWRFHAGTDLAAPMGTPVLATRAGRVTVSDVLGGYGLTVIMRHNDGELESRYAHLSQVAVKAGEWVEQGEVIGLVGSTGTSTGPHLHFEMRQLTAQGWVAVDAKEVLDYGITNLLAIIDNPLLALGQTEDSDEATLEHPADLPFRPAQPNAS